MREPTQGNYRRGVMSLVILSLLKQEQGYVSDRRELVGKRMTRVYYHLEPTGEAKLRELIAEYETVTAGVFAIIKGEGEA